MKTVSILLALFLCSSVQADGPIRKTLRVPQNILQKLHNTKTSCTGVQSVQNSCAGATTQNSYTGVRSCAGSVQAQNTSCAGIQGARIQNTSRVVPNATIHVHQRIRITENTDAYS